MKTYWLITLLQLTLIVILVYVGWEIITNLVEIEGENWMWMTEMHLFSVGLGFMTVCSSLIISRLGISRKSIKFSCLTQIALLAIWYFSGRSVFPYRHLYLLICGIITVIIPLLFAYIFARRILGTRKS